MSQATDEALLSAWRRGDDVAGNALFERHFDALFRFFRHKVGAAAEDLVQQTFLACLSKLDGFGAEASFRTYLFAIARSKLHDHLRENRRRGEPVDFSEVSLADMGSSPTRSFARHEEEALVQDALEHLPMDLQIAIELFYFEGMAAPEVAAVLGVPEGTVRSRLGRALERLREEIAKLGPTPALTAKTLGRLEGIARGRAP
jgi:RNA polymerase sigma factor (sigma-70 family)